MAIRDNQIAEAKKILRAAKKSYDSVLQENEQLKECIKNIVGTKSTDNDRNKKNF